MADLDSRRKAEGISELFRRRRTTEVLPRGLYPADLDEAYAIQQAFREIEEARGRGAVVGYKIGLTTPVMQKICAVDEPCYGVMFASEVHQRRAEISARDHCRIGVETEIAFQLGNDLLQGGERSRVAAAVERAMAKIRKTAA